jgi:cytochrome c556
MTIWRGLLAGACALGLTACGGAEDSSEATTDASSEFAEVIEARQQNLKNLGGAFKTISDQLRSGSPDVAEIQGATAKAQEIANMDFVSWFPEGSGAESGIDTDALDAIWTDAAGFAEAHEGLVAAAAELNEAALSGDVAEIGAKFQATGAACKNCHDNYRRDDD